MRTKVWNCSMSSLMVCKEVIPLWYVWEAIGMCWSPCNREQIEQQLLLL